MTTTARLWWLWWRVCWQIAAAHGGRSLAVRASFLVRSRSQPLNITRTQALLYRSPIVQLLNTTHDLQASIMHMSEAPPVGGATAFADSHAAWLGLPDSVKAKVRGTLARSTTEWNSCLQLSAIVCDSGGISAATSAYVGTIQIPRK